MESSNTSAGRVGAITAIVVGLVAIAATGMLVLTNEVTGTPVADNAIDSGDASEFYSLTGLDSAPAQLWSVKVETYDLEAYPSNTTTVDGDPLIYLQNTKDLQGAGGIVRLDAATGEQKWRAKLDYSASCTPIVRGRYLPCRNSTETPNQVRYVDLDTGEMTAPLSAPAKITNVVAADEKGTDFLVSVEGPGPGEITVHRGTPSDIDSDWTATYRVADPASSLYTDPKRDLGTLGFGSEPGESVTFDMSSGAQVPDPDEPYDPNEWNWSKKTTVRIVDAERRTFEILDERGAVVGSGTDAGKHSAISRIVGTDYESVVLVGTSAYDADSGEKLWTDSRLMRPQDDMPGSDPLSGISSEVTAIVDGTVILNLRDDYPAGSMVGIDLHTGKQLWQKNYRAQPVQMFLNDSNWVSIIDGKLQSFDTSTGDEVWSVNYPGKPADLFDDEARYSNDESLEKIDGQHLIVTTKSTVTVFGPS